MLRKFFILSFALSPLFAAEVAPPVKSPEQIQIEINQAQHDFEIAQKMFIPWYTGPIIAGSASNVPPGKVNIQPYLYFTLNYAAYNSQRKMMSAPNTYIFSPLFLFQTGITNYVDISIVPQAFFRWERGEFGANIADLPIQLGFQITHETPYIPKIRFLVGEIFPIGKYQNLNSHKLGLDATGEGAFQTSVGLNLNKVLWWYKLHPISLRFAGSYNIPNNDVHVYNYNAYGGGEGTDGRVDVGSTLSLDIGVEYSLTQKWVLATDLCYTYSNHSTFKGTPGESSPGVPAQTGLPSSDQLSLAPAVEYNINSDSGFIGGVWFTMTGRNSSSFVTLVLSYTTLF